jgi:hypothetical protein
MSTKNKTFDNKKNLTILGIFVILVAVGAGLYFDIFNLTGNVALEVTTVYDPNSTLEGKMSLSLKPGEFIPSDSQLTIFIGDDSYEYTLSELTDNPTSEGTFYGEGLSLTGEGSGYGVQGTKSSEDVSFVMKITGPGSASQGSSDSSEEETSEEETEEVEEGTSEEVVEEETSEEETEEALEEEEPVEEVEESTEEVEESEEGNTEESPGNSENSNAGGNGNGNSPITGNVVSDVEEEVEGVVSVDSPYTYEIEPGKKAELVSGDVSLSQQGNTVTVTTEAGASEFGYGQDYLGDSYDYVIEVDLTALELDVEEGDLVISVDYQDVSIASVSTTLSIDDPSQTSGIFTFIPVAKEDIRDFSLNTDEVFALKGKTGVEVASITKAQESNGRLLIRFTAGKYWLENSYDNINKEDLDFQIELDRAKFMKRLAQSFLESEIEAIDVEGYLGADSLVNLEELYPPEVVEEEPSDDSEDSSEDDEQEEIEEVVEEVVEEETEESGEATIEEEIIEEETSEEV